jgi:S-adenosyl methyltransferase
VHEIAQACDPGVRVVYVDHDPVVLAHGRNMLNGVPGTAIIGRDLLEPATILADEELLGLIDLRPDP